MGARLALPLTHRRDPVSSIPQERDHLLCARYSPFPRQRDPPAPPPSLPMELATGIEPVTSSLPRKRSTTELRERVPAANTATTPSMSVPPRGIEPRFPR